MPIMKKNSLTANELDTKVCEYIKIFDIGELGNQLSLIASGQLDEIYDRGPNANRYYQWLACLMRVLKPKQVVELGAAAGISTIMMASQLPKESKLYSVDIDKSIAWKWMNRDYPQVEKVLGDDTDPDLWRKNWSGSKFDGTFDMELGPDLSKTDIWFIDALHTKEHLQKELDLYTPFFKKGTVVVLDDIRMDGLWDIWRALPYDKCETTNPNHHTGFGHFIV
jgi:cephalosporin hydroxylase